MLALRASDYKGVLRLLHTAVEVDGPDPFPEQVLAELRSLIACDVVSYGDYNAHARAWRADSEFRYAGKSKTPLTNAISQAHLLLQHQDPLPPHQATTGRAVRWSDRLTRSKLRKLELYHAVIHELGAEYQLRLWLISPRGVLGGFDFDRSHRDFSDRDVQVLTFLHPHLVQMRQAAHARRSQSKLLTPREAEILAHVARGQTNRQIAANLYLSPGTVRKHLDNIYDKLNAHNRAEAVARAHELTPRAHGRSIS